MWRYTSDGRVDGRPVAHSRAFDHGIQTQNSEARPQSVRRGRSCTFQTPPQAATTRRQKQRARRARAHATRARARNTHTARLQTAAGREQRGQNRGGGNAGGPRGSRLAWRAVLTTGQAAQSAHETRRRVTRPCPPFAPATGSRGARPGRERGEGGSCGEGAVERELFRGRGA